MQMEVRCVIMVIVFSDSLVQDVAIVDVFGLEYFLVKVLSLEGRDLNAVVILVLSEVILN